MYKRAADGWRETIETRVPERDKQSLTALEQKAHRHREERGGVGTLAWGGVSAPFPSKHGLGPQKNHTGSRPSSARPAKSVSSILPKWAVDAPVISKSLACRTWISLCALNDHIWVDSLGFLLENFFQEIQGISRHLNTPDELSQNL